MRKASEDLGLRSMLEEIPDDRLLEQWPRIRREIQGIVADMDSYWVEKAIEHDVKLSSLFLDPFGSDALDSLKEVKG